MPAGRPPARFEATLDDLRGALTSGRYATDGMLPGERDLAGRLGVSRTTLRRVLAALVEEGRLVNRRGVGTFLAQATAQAAPDQTPPASSVEGFSSALRRRGLDVRVHDARVVAIEPDADTCLALACVPQDAVVRLRRVRHADGEPLLLDDSYMAGALWPDREPPEGSLHAALAERGVRLARSLTQVEAARASTAEAAALGLNPGDPVLQIRRVDYDTDGRPRLFIRARLRGDRVQILLTAGGL